MPFDTVRDTMYKYSRGAQEAFFAQPAFSFLFVWFAESQKGRMFADQRFEENSDTRHKERMSREIEQMGAEAKRTLFGASESSNLARELANFLGTLPASF